MLDWEIGEELYDLKRVYQQECQEEQSIGTAEAKAPSFDIGMICTPAVDLIFEEWHKSNQDSAFTVSA